MSDQDDENFDDESGLEAEDQVEENEERAEPGAADHDSDEKLDDDDDSKHAEDDEGEEPENVMSEVEEVDPDVVLSIEDMASCLSLVCKTGDGLSHAFVRLDAKKRKLTDVSILSSYPHLRYVDLSRNNLRDISVLNNLSHLLTINVDKNKLSSAAVPSDLPYLQSASFAENRIRTLTGIGSPLLERLCVNYNLLTSPSGLEQDRLKRLHTLELRGNKLQSLVGLNLPSLKNLYIASNEITSLEGVDQLTSLVVLHVRQNQLQVLDGFSEKQTNLTYINLRENQIADVKEVRKLACLPGLKSIVLSENPIAEEDDYRLEVLVSIKTLDKLDKDKYFEEEKNEAKEIREQRALQEEKMAEDNTTVETAAATPTASEE